MCLFFIHIPKTAGTSFRLAAEEMYGKSGIVYDYGVGSNKTSVEITNNIYSEPTDYWALYQYFSKNKIKMLGGHVDAAKYASLIGSTKTITFLRDPLQRIYSEYAHKVRHNNYLGSFFEFYSRPQMQNRQTKILHGVHLEALGLVGITELYSQSLNIFNTSFNASIPVREDNKGVKKIGALHKISDVDKNNLEIMNKKDINLYKYAVKLFHQRLMFHDKSLPWAHARIMECNVKSVSGWAWYSNDSDTPVDIEVWVNDVFYTMVKASIFRPGLLKLLPPRGGYVGFHLRLALSPSDYVQCRVAATGQKFPLNPIIVT